MTFFVDVIIELMVPYIGPLYKAFSRRVTDRTPRGEISYRGARFIPQFFAFYVLCISKNEAFPIIITVEATQIELTGSIFYSYQLPVLSFED